VSSGSGLGAHFCRIRATGGTGVEKRDDELYDLAQPVVEGMGFALVTVDDIVEHGRRVFRLYIDHRRGISVEDCASVSREVEYLLDARFDFEGTYVLEVSSPGLDHRLRRPREYAHFVGKRARVVLHEPLDGANVIEGVLTAADSDGVVLTVGDGAGIRLEHLEIARANLLP